MKKLKLQDQSNESEENYNNQLEENNNDQSFETKSKKKNDESSSINDELGIKHDENIYEYNEERLTFVHDPIYSLQNSSSAQIIEKINKCKYLFGFRNPNEYNIFINENQKKKFLFSCYENSTCKGRWFCSKSTREFNMDIKHIKKYSETINHSEIENFLTLKKQFKCSSNFLLEVYYKGNLYGYIKEPNKYCYDTFFEVYNHKNKLKYKLYTNYHQCGFCCKCFRISQYCEVYIPIYKPNTKVFLDNNIGVLKKINDNGYNRIMNNVCSYIINFPPQATPQEKILLIMSVILMDYRYYGS